MVVTTLVEEITREIADLEENYNDFREKERLVKLEKQAMADMVPVAMRASNADKRYVEEFKKRLFSVYQKAKDILKTATLHERVVLYNVLKNSEIEELRWLAELAEINANITTYNAGNKCATCKRFFRNRRREVLVKGIGIIYEDLCPPCERVLKVPEGMEKAINDLALSARSLTELKQRVSEAARKFRLKCNKEFVVTYKNFENLGYIRCLIPPEWAMKNCPFHGERPQPFIQMTPVTFMPEPAPDHFPTDIVLDPDRGTLELLPKHGNDS